jgi:hypothetical protein
MIPDYPLGERRGPQERDMNDNVLGIEEGYSWTPSNLQSIQEAAHLSGHTIQNGASLHPDPSLSGPVMFSLKEMGYSETELDKICAYFGADLIAIMESRLLPKLCPAYSEYKIVNIQRIQTCPSKISLHALNRIHKQILLPLLRRPSLQKFKTSVLACAANINTPGFDTLRSIETVLLSAAYVSFFFFFFFLHTKKNFY